MWRIGFGLERIGLAAQRRPLIFSVFILLLTVVAGVHLTRVSFNGSVLSVLPDQSEAFRDYDRLKDEYRNFSRDITILVQSERLLTAAGLEDLRNLQLDISLSEGIAQSVSIFSTPDFDPLTGENRAWFPPAFSSDAQALDLIERLIDKYPQAASLYSREQKVAVIVASISAGIQEDDEKSFAAYRALRETAESLAPPDFKLSFTGLTPVGATVLSALISDQLKLTIIGLILGTGIAFYIFRSFLAAFACAIPPALTAMWALGLFAFFDISINYLTTVLPTLALILAFADGIFLYFRWQTLNAGNDDLNANLTEAIAKVGPASSLTSITTALAFLSFSYAESEALNHFAWLGAGVVMLAFIAVIIGLPLMLHWAIRFQLAKPGGAREPMFQNVGRYARRFALGYPAAIAGAGLALMLALSLMQQFVRAEYNLTDYLPYDSDVRYGEKLANEVIGGRSLLLISVPFAEPGIFASKANRERLAAVEAAVAERFDRSLIFSANRVLETLETEAARRRITELAEEAPESARTDFISKDSSAALLTVRLPSDASALTVSEEVAHIRATLDKLDYGDAVRITGFPVLMSIEFSNLINQLRVSLMIAILLGVMIVGIATRSPFITLAAVTPNLLPIFFVQFVLYLRGGTINLSEVVALTVAFGIAIDNAVHLINVYDAQRRLGKEVRLALSTAMEEVGPALTAGTVIICVSTLVTQISALPVVPVLGQLMIATLIVALLSNLILLPANILTLERFREAYRLRRGLLSTEEQDRL